METANNKEQLKKLKLKARRKEVQEQNDLRGILATPSGRRFIWKHLSECGTFHTSFTGEQTNLTHFKLGQQNIGFYLLSQIHQADPDAYSLMCREAEGEKRDA